MDIPSFIAGILVVFIIIWGLNGIRKIPYQRLDDPTAEIQFHTLRNKPHCPDCNSYNLILVDDHAGVPWLKGHVSELDRFRCKKCGREFNDEDWQDAKSYT